MELVRGTPCEAAINLAMEKARAIVDGQVAPYEGARAIAALGSMDCYDYLQEGVEAVDEMAAFWLFVDDWEQRQDSDSARAEISREIREAARTLLEQFG
jgi:hypothetical protein